MLTSFTTAISALNANETAIDVVGNNLANLNTAGYKEVSVDFSDMMSQSTGADTEVGLGLREPTTRRIFTTGAIQPNTGPLTAAIQGQGFFQLQGDAGNTTYTRVGNFRVNGAGTLVSQSGDAVMGWSAVNGAVNAQTGAGPIYISQQPLPAKQTTELTIDMNLDAGADVASTTTVPVTFVDSLGKTHVLSLTLQKTADNVWSYTAGIPADELTGTGTVTTTNAAHTLNFNSSGVLQFPGPPATPITSEGIAIAGLANGAADMTINWNWALENGVTPRVTQQTGVSTPSSTWQDGYTMSDMTDLKIDDGGSVIGQYSNGQTMVLAQLGLVSIRNPDSLSSVGSNAYAATVDTAVAPLAPAGSGGRGKIIGQATESSNVDIAKEFTNLITYQRAYQAASRVISTADEISQDIINLKR